MRSTLSLLFVSLTAVSWAGIADEFVLIPANPAFAFAKSLNPHSSDPGKTPPITTASYLCHNADTNAENAEILTDTGRAAAGSGPGPPGARGGGARGGAVVCWWACGWRLCWGGRGR